MSNEFNEGVQILLERMKTHPNEFDGLLKGADDFNNRIFTSRWGAVVAKYWPVLTDEEKQAIEAGLHEANRLNLTAAVMDTLINKDTHKHGEFAYEVSQGKLGHAVQGSVSGVGVYNPMLSAVASSNVPISVAKEIK